MKKLFLFLLLIPTITSAQYSTYYGKGYDLKADIDVDVNKNVNVSGYVNKTIRTIDYGALANANAKREANRIENLRIANEKQRQELIEIAKNPNKAFDYGIDNTLNIPKDRAKLNGFKKLVWYHKIPNESLFTRTQKSDFSYENVSDNFVKTSIFLSLPVKPSGIKDKKRFAAIKKAYPDIVFTDLEEHIKALLSERKEGEYSEELDAFIHKTDLNKTTIFGIDGFKNTLIMENDYEYIIKDNYNAVSNGILLIAGVRYSGDKDEITFEDLEGRRYYFRKLVEKIISSQNVYDIK